MIELNVRESSWGRPQPVSLSATALAEPAPLSRADLLARVLEEIDYGLLLVDARGVLSWANELGLREVIGGGALRLVQGRVQTQSAGEQAAFNAAVADAHRGLRRMLTLGDGEAGVSVAVTPMGGEDGGEPMALLLFGKRQAHQTLSLDFYARTHGLTSAEQTVLKQMSLGHKPMDIARRQGVAISTVRSHIKNIRLKTGTGSIRELLGQVAVLPPITPAMRFGGQAAATGASGLLN